MGYVAGVDLGTTYSAAAVFGPEGLTAIDLSPNSTVMPSVVAVRPGGEVLTGANAERRLVSEPSTVAREFKRRLGDSTPILMGGTPYATADLTGYLLASIVELVSERQGEPPALVGLSHPANYGDFKLDLLEAAARTAGVAATTFVAEPVAAAVHYSQTERVATDDVIAVYDLGGGTFDASLVRRTPDGFEVIGTPDGMDRFGGIDLDEAVLGHVRRSVAGGLDDVDTSDLAVMAALNRLRDDCRTAKEALSGDAEVEIPVMVPGLHTEVRLTRPEFEDMIRPRVDETIEVLRRTIRSAGIEVDDISRVLLVGGSSRIPLVGEMVTHELGKPVGLDAHPKLTVALGTARVAAGEVAGPESPAVPPIVASRDTTELAELGRLATPGEMAAGSAEAVPAPAPMTEPEPARPPAGVPEPTTSPRGIRWPMIAAVVVALGLVVAGAIVALTVGGDGDEPTGEPVATIEETTDVAVPAVDGREAVAARDALAAAGLDVEVEYVEVASTSADDGFVIAQSIPAGSSVEPGTEIRITVGRATAVADTTSPAPSTIPTTTPTTTTTAPTTTTSTTTPPSAEEQLAMLIDEDMAPVAAIAENWVPQLSAKRVGLEDQGIVYGHAEILDDHRAHREEHGAVLVDGGTYNFNLDGDQMEGWFMTIVPEPFATAEGALNWCRRQGIGRDDCFAKFLSADSENTDGTIKLQ